MAKAAPIIVLAFVVLSAGLPEAGQGGQSAEHWVGTWFAASTARAPQVPSSPAPATGPDLAMPPAVLAVAPKQQLTVGALSSLHFDNQTLRQVAHITLGGSRFRVVLSNTFGVVPLTIGAAQIG